MKVFLKLLITLARILRNMHRLLLNRFTNPLRVYFSFRYEVEWFLNFNAMITANCFVIPTAIIYKVESKRVAVLNVVHSSRDLASLIEKESWKFK